MKKRVFSILLTLCMVLTLFPVSALAVEGEAEAAVCTCEAACAAEDMNAECPVCGAEGAAAESCGKYAAPEDPAEADAETDPEPEQTAVEKVQAMLDALPDAEELEEADEAVVNAAYEAAQDAYDALEALSPEEVKQITGMEKLAALMDWFNGQVSTLADPTDETALKNALAAGGTVKLGGDIDITSKLDIKNGPVTLDLNGYVIKMTGDDGVIEVYSGEKLTLQDSNSTATHSGAYAGLPSGGVITGGNTRWGGGVRNGGEFTMTGGTITGCTATALSGGSGVYNKDTLKNSSTTGATICYGTLCNDTTNGGKIEGNKVEFYNGNTLYAWEVVPNNGKAVEPTDPTPTVTDDAWYNGTTEYNFNTPVTGTLRLDLKSTKGNLTLKVENKGATPSEVKLSVTGPNSYSNEVTLNAANSWTATIESLIPGTYTVSEVANSADVAGYDLAVSGEGNVTIEAGSSVTQTITNTYTAKLGKLKLKR